MREMGEGCECGEMMERISESVCERERGRGVNGCKLTLKVSVGM